MNDELQLRRECFSDAQSLWNAALVVTFAADRDRIRSFVHFPAAPVEERPPQREPRRGGNAVASMATRWLIAGAVGALFGALLCAGRRT